MNLGQPTGFPNGLNLLKNNDFLKSLPIPCFSPDWFSYINDFLTYDAGDWTVTETGTATQAVGNEAGGVLVITNGTSDDNSSEQQLKGESFKFDTSKELYFATRFKINDVDQTDFLIGLAITDTTLIDGTTDGVFFRSADGSADLNFVAEKDSAETVSTDALTTTDDTYIKAEFYLRNGQLHFRMVSEATTQVIAGGTIATTNLPDDEELTVSFAVQNGEASAQTMTIDYIVVVAER